MTTRDIIGVIESASTEIALFLFALPVLAGLLRLVHGRGNGAGKPWCYGYSVLVYAVSIPGAMAAVLSGYTLLFTGENLLDQSIVVYILPLIAMFVTLMLIAKFVDLDDVPGFDRISGLMGLLGITGLGLLLLSRLHFFVGFFGSFTMLIGVGIFLFMVLKWGAGRVFRGPGEEKKNLPKPHF